jgi:methionyl-tRNA synthetase
MVVKKKSVKKVSGKKVEKKKFYITTAIDYPNAEPHIGHAYQKVVADILARWHKILGEDVFFLTGTDEHGKKIQETAIKAGKQPRQFVDELSVKFKEAWKSLNVDYDRFIRTTDEDHKKVVQNAIKKCDENGDIYKGTYEGLYCVGCEAYYTEKDLIDGCCPLHKKPVEKLKEESYFFRLSKYQKFLLELYKNPKFILPEERRNEMISRVKEGLKDLSISRTSFDWGIPFPLDKKHIVYVWFDALFNYVSGAGKNQEYWPATVHLLGKDNGWFHSVYWPAFLKSAGYELPKTVFIHGFLTFNGQKISKSLGNVISPKYLAEKYGADSVRYFIGRNFVFGQDGDFFEKLLVERHNNELANKLGNLVSRVTALAEMYGIDKKTGNKLVKKLNLKLIKKYFENYEIDKALSEIFSFVDVCNEYVQEKKLWETQDKKALYELIDSIKSLAIVLWPFIPETSEKIAKQLDFKINYENITKNLDYKKIKKSEILFKKIEVEGEAKAIKPNLNKAKKHGKIEGLATMSDIIEYGDWEKVKLVVGEIQNVEDIEGADKLYKLQVDIGEEVRTVCAGIKKFYSKDELKGKKVVLLKNLAPRKLRGIESAGMLLAAVNKDETKVVLISPSDEIEVGSIIR